MISQNGVADDSRDKRIYYSAGAATTRSTARSSNGGPASMVPIPPQTTSSKCQGILSEAMENSSWCRRCRGGSSGRWGLVDGHFRQRRATNPGSTTPENLKGAKSSATSVSTRLRKATTIDCNRRFSRWRE